MHELRLVAVSEDGSYAVLAVPGRSGRFALPIDDRLRTVVRGQFSRLAQYEIEVESPLRPKEIQDRIRAGETAEEIADVSGLPVDRIKRFEGPPLAERARWAQEAQNASVRGGGDPLSGPGPRLGEVVTRRLAEAGASPEETEWDSRKRHDGFWQVQLAYTVAGRMRVAEWVYDPRGNHVTPDDEEAARLSLDEADLPAPGPVTRQTATVTRIGSRAAGSAHGGQRPEPDYRDAGSRAPRPGAATTPAGLAGVPVHPSRQSGRGPHRADPARPAPLREAFAPREPIRQAPAADSPAADSPAASAQPRAPQASDPHSPAQPRRPSPPVSRQATSPPTGSSQAGKPTGSSQAGKPTGSSQAGKPTADRVRAKRADETAAASGAAGSQGDEHRDGANPPRPRRKGSGGRSRRSSVPSWDEIMFGTSRQPE